jgi:glycosyltransferase 2 family protein
VSSGPGTRRPPAAREGPAAPEPAPPAPRRSGRRRLVGLAAAACVLAFLGLALADGWSRVADHPWDLQPGLLVAGLAVLLVFYAASGAGYGAILARLHAGGPPAAVTRAIWAKSLLGRYVPGNVLMVAGRVVMGHERGVPRRVSLAATVYEQALSLGVAAAGAVVFVALYSDLGQGARLWLLALVPACLVLLHPRLFGPLSGRALRHAGREPLPRLLTPREVAGLTGWYALVAVLLGLGVWLLVRSAAGAEAGGPAFVGLAFLLAFAVAIVAFVFPSGLGVRDGAFALALTQNLPGAVAVAVSVGVRLVLILVELAYVGAVVLIGRRRGDP